VFRLEDDTLDEFPDGAATLRAAIERHPDLTILATGPLTTIDAVLRAPNAPDVSNVTVFWMGGALAAGNVLPQYGGTGAEVRAAQRP
jgi:inosine-uridine nucleoside N-ribohydrolase